MSQQHPGQDAQPGGDDGAVEQAGDVAFRSAPPDQQDQRAAQDWVGPEIEGIGEGGVRRDILHIEIPAAQGIAEHPRQLAGRHQQPGEPAGRPVQPHTDQDGEHARGAQCQVGDVAPHARRHGVVGGDGQQTDTEIDPPENGVVGPG